MDRSKVQTEISSFFKNELQRVKDSENEISETDHIEISVVETRGRKRSKSRKKSRNERRKSCYRKLSSTNTEDLVKNVLIP